MRRGAIVWVVLAGPSVMLCLFASFAAAAVLLPPDLAMQAVFGVPVFLVTGSACGTAMLRRAWPSVRAWIVALALAGVLAILAASILYGMTTPGETAVVGIILFSTALWTVWRLSPRLAVSS